MTIASGGTLTGTSVTDSFVFHQGGDPNPGDSDYHDYIQRVSGDFSGIDFDSSISTSGAPGGDLTLTSFSVSGNRITLGHSVLLGAGTATATLARTGGVTATFDSPVLALSTTKVANTTHSDTFTPPNPNPANTNHTLTALTDLPFKITANGSTSRLVDGKTYFVGGVSGDTFQLSETSGGPILSFDTTGLGSAFHGLSEVVHLTPATGLQELAIHLTGGPGVPPSNTLLGPGAVPLTSVSPPSGDGVSSVTSLVSGGGILLGVNGNTADADANPPVKPYIASSLMTAGPNITINTASNTNVTTNSQNSPTELLAPRLPTPTTHSDTN